MYYYNKKTNQVSWTKPQGFGNTYWKAVVDKATGKTYYYNKQTKMVQWTMPENFKEGNVKSGTISGKKMKQTTEDQDEEVDTWQWAAWPNAKTFFQCQMGVEEVEVVNE